MEDDICFLCVTQLVAKLFAIFYLRIWELMIIYVSFTQNQNNAMNVAVK